MVSGFGRHFGLGMRLKIGTVDSEDDSTGRGGSIFITDGEKGGGQ